MKNNFTNFNLIERLWTDSHEKQRVRGMRRYAAMITLLLTLACGQAWGETEILSLDFTSWSSAAVSAGGTANDCYFKSATTITNGTGVVFGGNMSTSANYMAIPLSGIHGAITITVTHESARPTVRYHLTGYDATPTSSNLSTAPSNTSDERIASNGTSTTWTIPANKAYGVFYLGVGGNLSSKTLKSVTITTPDLTNWSTSTFYSTYSTSNLSASALISGASFSNNVIFTGFSAVNNSTGCTSSVSSPHDFSSLASATKYYRLEPGSSSVITLAALCNVKSIRLYGNGNGSSRKVTTTVAIVSGSGSTFTISNFSMSNAPATIAEYTTGDLTAKSGYDANTYYTYTISFPDNCDIYGIYVETASAASGHTITYDCNEGTSGCPSRASNQTALPDPLPAGPTAAGYTFGGWYTDEDLTVSAVAGAEIDDDVTLYAKMTPYYFNYNYDKASSYGHYSMGGNLSYTQALDGNSTYYFYFNDGGSHQYALAGASTMTSASCTDWNFTIDYNTYCGITTTAPGDYVFTIDESDKANKLVVSVEYPSSVSITLARNDGSGSTSTWYAADGGTIPTPPNPSDRDGYSFEGWYADEDCTEPWDWSETVSSATTLYAKWSHAWYYHEAWSDPAWKSNLMTRSTNGTYWYWYTYASAENREFKIQQNSVWYNRDYNSPGYLCTNIDNMNSSSNTWNTTDTRCAVNYNGGRYYILVFPPNTSANSTDDPIICASTSLPEEFYAVPSSRTIYFDNSDAAWTNIYFRKGRTCHSEATALSLVSGTASLYKVTTASAYVGYQAFHLANNQSATGSSTNIYTVNGGDKAITKATVFQKYNLDADVTFTPGDADGDPSDGCQYYDVEKTTGMKTDNVAITAPTNGTIRVSYTNTSGSSANFTSGNADLAHTCIITPEGIGDTGYEVSGMTVNGSAHTSGTTYTITGATTIAATFSLIDYTVDYSTPSNGDYTIKVASGSASSADKTANYGQTITLAASASEGYHFTGWTITNTDNSTDITSSVSLSSQTENATFTMPAANISITASFAINTYTVTFASNNDSYGSVSSTSVASVPHGSEVDIDDNELTLNETTVTATAEKSTAAYTYAFSSWSVSDGAKITEAQTITATFTRTANTYDVAFTLTNAAYSSGTNEGDDVATYGTDYEVVFAATSGYSFPSSITVTIGGDEATEETDYTWDKSTGTVTVKGASILGDIEIEIEAEADVTTYSVTYSKGDATGGTAPSDATAHDSGDEVTVADTTGCKFVYAGHTFRGWTDGTTFYLVGQKFNITSDVTLTAVWDSGSGGGNCELFSTDFSDDDWDEITNICNSANSDDETHNGITFHSYYKEAKPFVVDNSAGTLTWCNNNMGNNYWIAIPITGVNGSITITVDNGSSATRFNYATKQETSVSGSPGSGTSTSSADPSTVTISNLDKSNYVVYLGRQGSSNTTLTSITITTPCAGSGYEVSFANMTGFGGLTTLPSDIEGIPSGKKLVQPEDPEADGYTFGGWYSDAACTAGNEIDWSTMTITADKKIYAKWCASHTVAWVVNGSAYSTGSPTTSTTDCDGITVMPTAPADNTLSCATSFRGWSATNLYGEATNTQPADLFVTAANAPTIDADKTFYAVFGTATDEAYVGTVLWSEDWTGADNNSKPTSPTASGSIVYGGASVTYAWTDGVGTSAVASKVTTSDIGAGGASPEAQIGKKGSGDGAAGGYLTVSGIPVGGAKTITVEYLKNNRTIDVSYYLDDVYAGHASVTSATSGSFDIDCSSKSTLKLIFEATTTNTVRLDNIVVKIKEDGATGYRCICPSLSVTPKLVTASTPIFITSAASKTVRSQDTLQIVGSGLKKNAELSLSGVGTKFALKSGKNGALTTDETGAIDTVAYIYYTPAVGDTDDGLDSYNSFTVTDGTNSETVSQALIGRHLPANFVIAAKVEDKWYALPANMGQSDAASSRAIVEVEVNNTTTPDTATTTLANVYSLIDVPTAVHEKDSGDYVILWMQGKDKPLYGNPSNAQVGSSTKSVINNLDKDYWWLLTQKNTSITNAADAKYNVSVANGNTNNPLKINSAGTYWGLYQYGTITEIRLLTWVCAVPAAPTISGTTTYSTGETITLTASHDGSNHEATTTYTWYKGATWDVASAADPVQDAATGSSGYTLTIASCTAEDAGTYWCEASNGSCTAHNSTGYEIDVPLGAHTLTWEPNVNTAESSIGTHSKNSTTSLINKTSDMSNLGNYGSLTIESSKKDNLTSKIGTPASYDADKYMYVTFDVPTNYEFVPSSASVKVQPVGENEHKAVILELSDASGHSISNTPVKCDGTSGGKTTTVTLSNDGGVAFEGTVTLKIYVYAHADASASSNNCYRLGSPITIDGEVNYVCPERPTITSPTAPQSIKLYSDQNKTLSVSATAYSSGTLNYQWQKDGVNIVGATSSSYTVVGSTLTAGTTYVYTCDVSQTSPDACATVTSPAVTIKAASTDCEYTEIASAVLTSKSAADRVNATLLVNGLADMSSGSCKLNGKGAYFGLQLASGSFEVGDSILFKIKGGDDSDVYLFATTDTTGLTTSDAIYSQSSISKGTDYILRCKVTEGMLTALNTSKKIAIVRRTKDGVLKQNHSVYYVKVKRYGCPDIFIYDDAAATHEWSDDDNWIGPAGHGSGLPTSEDRIFINESVTVDTDEAAAAEIHITNGSMVTVEKSITVGDVIIENGSTLNIAKDGETAITVATNSLHLMGGWNSSYTKYDMPRIYIDPASTLTKEEDVVNFDISVDARSYYPFAVPFRVKVSDINYANSTLAYYSNYGPTGQYVIKEYDGERRAESGPDRVNNWKVVPQKDDKSKDVYLEPGRGYIMTAVSLPAYGGGVIRIPLEFDNAWTAEGEQGTVDEVTKNVVAVTAWEGDATEDGKKSNKGWNMMGVPFMSCYATSAAMYAGEGAAAVMQGKYDFNTGSWTENEIRYVSVPMHDFSEYIQRDITDAETILIPGWCFFIQIEEGGDLTFLTTKQADESELPIYAPKRKNAEMPVEKTGIILSGGEASDKTTILVSDKYSAADYEINADLEKMFGNGYTLATYSLSGSTRLAYNAMSTSDATAVIPIGYRAPAEGEYTFSINPRYAESGAFSRVDLIDYETSTVTNLLYGPYTFESDRTQNDARFALNVVMAPQTPTDIESISDEGLEMSGAHKMIIDEKLYIILDGKMYDATGKVVKGGQK